MALPYFFHRSICQLTEDRQSFKLLSFSSIQSLLLLVSSDDRDTLERYNWVADTYPNLKKLLFIQFTQEKKLDHRVVNGILKINKRSFSFFGKPSTDLKNVVRSERFDLLINADERNLLQMHVIAAAATSGMKIGSPLGDCKQLYPISLYSQTATTFEEYITNCHDYLNALSGDSETKKG